MKHARMKKTSLVPGGASQQGIVLLDAVIAIVIFSFGILGMVVLQAAAVKLAGDAKYRTDAAMLADQVIAQMWTVDPSTLASSYGSSGGAGFTAWKSIVTTTGTGRLPGAAANPPTIVVGTNNLITVTVKWQAPNDTGTHSYVSITQINP
jgi:type IV pilus assembly protein PilV